MRLITLTIGLSLMLAGVQVRAEEYCIYIKSRVTGEEKVHTCREFKSYAECQAAADKVDGYCGSPPAK